MMSDQLTMLFFTIEKFFSYQNHVISDCKILFSYVITLLSWNTYIIFHEYLWSEATRLEPYVDWTVFLRSVKYFSYWLYHNVMIEDIFKSSDRFTEEIEEQLVDEEEEVDSVSEEVDDWQYASLRFFLFVVVIKRMKSKILPFWS